MAACNQGVSQDRVTSEGRTLFLKDHRLTASISCRLLSEGHLSSCYMSLSNKASKKASASKMEATVFCSLLTEVTFCHLCCILVIPTKSLGLAHTQGGEFQEGSHWGHHRGCLPHIPSISPFFIASITSHSWCSLPLSPERTSKSHLMEGSRRPVTNQLVE